MHIASGDLWAGAEAQLFTLARKLAENPDITVTVVLLNHGKLEQELNRIGINVVVIDETITGSLMILVQMTKIIRCSGADVIHTHRIKENILGSIAGLLAGGIPSIRTVHGAPEHKPSPLQAHKYFVAFLDRFCAHYLQQSIVAVSTDLATILGENLPMKKISVIENGIDISDFEVLRQSRINNRCYKEDNHRIGIAGRLAPVKRVDIFIRAIQFLMDNYHDMSASFHIYGDGPLRSNLEQLCKELGVSHLVAFKGHCNDIYSELASLDAIVMTSDHEGIPMILLEALALGLPVIAHATGGIPEILGNGKYGTLVSDHTPPGYAKAIVRLLTDTELQGNHREETITDHIAMRFSAELNALRYIALYKNIAC